MSETHEHLEHAEHAEHAAHNPFDKRVAFTIAVVAATLAGVAMVGHRKHNEVITLKTEAAELEVKASNGWAWYQATKARQQEFGLNASLMVMMASDKAPEKTKQVIEKLQAGLVELKTIQEKPKRDDSLKKMMKEFAGVENELREGLKPWQQLQVAMWREKVLEYDGDLDERKKAAEAESAKAKQTRATAEHVHHQADWLDFAHLAVELGLVLCSIALLTKRKIFWLTGVFVSIFGIALLIYAFSLPSHGHETHQDDHAQQEHKEDAKHKEKPSAHKVEAEGH